MAPVMVESCLRIMAPVTRNAFNGAWHNFWEIVSKRHGTSYRKEYLSISTSCWIEHKKILALVYGEGYLKIMATTYGK